jgi:CheY-like chemotaxis protein/GAF domain-containing protein
MSSDADIGRPNRSVNDFHSVEELHQALKSMSVQSSSSDGQYISFVHPELEQNLFGEHLSPLLEGEEGSVGSQSEAPENHAFDPKLDWVLENYDRETTEPQTLNDELQRLLVLKSYLVLDDNRKQSFERITGLASRMFKCPMALISLVDLGRQWFLSNRGLGETRETSRKYAFCAHVIMSKENFLVVKDATKDVRFQNNPLVTGPPDIRFYAGAPLISPEGYKLGTLCVLDTKPRPNGISLEEKQNLMELAALAVQAAVNNRSLKTQQFNDPAQMIAYTAHDLLTPLNGMQLSLSLLVNDEDFNSKLTAAQRESINTASTCATVLERICKSAIDTIRNDRQPPPPSTKSSQRPGTTSKDEVKNLRHRRRIIQNPVVMADFVKTLYAVLEPFPKTVPLLITIHPKVPKIVMMNDLKVFRAAVNYLTNACSKTETGSVHLSISIKERHGGKKLLFECEDTGPGVSAEAVGSLFRPIRDSDQGDDDNMASNCMKPNPDGTLEAVSQLELPNLGLGLYSVAVNMSSVGGDYGYRPRSNIRSSVPNGTQNGRSQNENGAVFWFSIPLVEPGTSVGGYKNHNLLQSLEHMNSSLREFAADEPRSQGGMVRILSTPSLSGKDANQIYSSFTMLLESEGLPNDDFAGSLVAPTVNLNLMDQSHGRSNQPPNEIFLGPPQGVSCLATEETEPMELEVPLQEGGERKRRALVIEDSLVVRKSLTKVLTRLGFEAVQAVDGMEGLKELKSSFFDVVLCDFLMPVMDGLDCVLQYRVWEQENRPFFRQYIIGISAHAGENDISKGMEVGMDDFKPKPVTYKQLVDLEKCEELRRIGAKLDEILSAGTSMKDMIGRPYKSDPSSTSFAADQSGTCDTAIHFCLVVSEGDTIDSRLVESVAESKGWKVVKVSDGESALRLLMVRNWDAVLLDESLPLLEAAQCVGRFRKWEEQNRVNRQANVGLWSSSSVIPKLSPKSMIQLPHGFDFLLGKPTRVDDVEYIMTGAERNQSDFGIRNLVSR